MEEKKIHRQNFIASIIISLISIFFIFNSMKLPKESKIWPLCTLVIILIMSFIMGVNEYKKYKNQVSEINLFSKVKNPIIIVVMTCLYSILMEKIGFFIASSIFLPLLMIYFRQKNVVYIFVSVIVLLIFIYYLFVIQLKLIMP